MAWMNQQMAHKVNGIRGSVIVTTVLDILSDTTWVNFKEKHVSMQEYGNTRFNDLTVVCYYFKNRFCLTRAGNDIGYASFGANNVLKRLKRVNVEVIIEIAHAMIVCELLTINDITHILTDPVYPPAEYNCKQRGAFVVTASSSMYKYCAKRMVVESFNKWGSKQIAASKLGITIDVFNHWFHIIVVNPMIKYKQDK